MPTTGSTSTGYAHFIILVIICSSHRPINRLARLSTPTACSGTSAGGHLSRDASITCGTSHHFACKSTGKQSSQNHKIHRICSSQTAFVPHLGLHIGYACQCVIGFFCDLNIVLMYRACGCNSNTIVKKWDSVGVISTSLCVWTILEFAA